MYLNKNFNKNVIIISFLLFFNLKIFQSFPFEGFFFKIQGIFIIFSICFSFTYLIFILKRGRISKIFIYIIFIMIFIPLYSAYRAKIEFGQPLIFGILAERSWFLLGLVLFLFYFLKTKKFKFEDIKLSFLIFSILSLLTITFIYIYSIYFGLYNDYNFVKETINRGIRIKFQTFFITFGVIYFYIKYNLQKSLNSLILFLSFLFFIILIIKSRTFILFLLSTFFIFILLNYSFKRTNIYIFKFIFFISFILLVIYIFFPEYLFMMKDLFIDMFVVLKGQVSNDPSANARLAEFFIVYDYLKQNLLCIFFGTGKISHQWNGGYENIFGYFYPSDIGIIGGLFLYGVIGLILLFILPFIFSIIEIKRFLINYNIYKMLAKCSDFYVFIISLNYLLIFYLLKSIQGGFYFSDFRWIIVFIILYAFNRIYSKLEINGLKWKK